MSSHAFGDIFLFSPIFCIPTSHFDGHSVGLLWPATFFTVHFLISELFHCPERCVQCSVKGYCCVTADDILFLITPNSAFRVQCLPYNFGYIPSTVETHSSCIYSQQSVAVVQSTRHGHLHQWLQRILPQRLLDA